MSPCANRDEKQGRRGRRRGQVKSQCWAAYFALLLAAGLGIGSRTSAGGGAGAPSGDPFAGEDAGAPSLERILIDRARHGFIKAESKEPFHPWGVNYGNAGRLMEDFWPDSKKPDEAMQGLRHFAVGKPIVIEETFPLSCSAVELEKFMRASRAYACGWLGHYDGNNLEDYAALEHAGKLTIAQSIYREWLRLFVRLGPGGGAEFP